MPLKKGKKKGKAKAKKSKDSAESKEKFDPLAPRVIPPPPRPMENLLKMLLTQEVNEKELHGFKVSIKALEELTPQEIRDLKVVFDVFDEDSDGYIGSHELKRAMKALGFKVTRSEAKALIADSNFNGKGQADFNEFLDVVISKQGDARDVHGELVKGFQLFTDASGVITLDSLRAASQETGAGLKDDELREMLEEADLNGDSMVDLEEFIRIMLQTNIF